MGCRFLGGIYGKTIRTDGKDGQRIFLDCIGRVIKVNGKRKNISQETLAEYLGVSESTISRYETGKQDPFASTLPLISHYCDFPIKEFFSQETGKQLAMGKR